MRNISDEFATNIKCCLPYRLSPEYLAAAAKVAAARGKRRVVEPEQMALPTIVRKRKQALTATKSQPRVPPIIAARRARKYHSNCAARMAKAGSFGTKFGRITSLPNLPVRPRAT